MDGGTWKAAVHGITEGQTRLSGFTFTFHFHASEKEMATHSSVLAWRIPGTGEPGGLPSLGSHRVRNDWRDLAAAVYIVNDTLSVCLTLPFPSCVHMSALYSCVSIPTLQIGSSVAFFLTPHMYINIQPLFFSFWLASLHMTASMSIHTSTNDSVSFFFIAHSLETEISPWTVLCSEK